MGSIYKRGNVYWLKYYNNGKCHRESSRSDDIKDAEKLLVLRESEILKEGRPGFIYQKVRFNEVCQDYIRNLKINKKKAFDDQGKMLKAYVDEALRARVFLATEAFDVRRYVERRFEQVGNPRIFVCGDMNDGPGRKYFEREYLYFDLVSNIQGDIFFARRFLNHALFDFDETIRWSTQFKDKIEVWARQQPGITSALVGARSTEQAEANAAAGAWRLSSEEMAGLVKAL